MKEVYLKNKIYFLRKMISIKNNNYLKMKKEIYFL